jgi:hypothetical protein
MIHPPLISPSLHPLRPSSPLSPSLLGTFLSHSVDGRILLEIDEPFAREALLIIHALKRRKLLSCIGKLKLRKKKNLEVIIHSISMYCNVERGGGIS